MLYSKLNQHTLTHGPHTRTRTQQCVLYCSWTPPWNHVSSLTFHAMRNDWTRSYWVRDFFSRWSQFFYCLALLSSTVRHPSSQPHVPVGALRSHSLINHERAPLAWPHHFCPAISHNIRNENHIIVMQKVASLKPCPHSEALGRTEGTGQLICQINDTVTRWDMLL